MPAIVLLFGPPGSGKGTQARLLSEWTGFAAVSTGDLLRAEVASRSPLGREVESILASGKYVPDELVNRLVAGQLDRLHGSGLILDGYPRTVPQAAYLDSALAGRGLPPPVAFHLDVAAEVLVERLSSRWVCSRCSRLYNLPNLEPDAVPPCQACGGPLMRRSDDEPDVIRKRLATYQDLTGPVLDYYRRGSYFCVDGSQAPDLVFAALQKCSIKELGLPADK